MTTTLRCGVFTLARAPCALAKLNVSFTNFSDEHQRGTTYLHVVSALPTGGAPHAILRSRQNVQAHILLGRW